MMLFFGNHGDYEVTCKFLNKEGQRIAKKRVCHNVSKKEARDGMRDYITNRFSDTIDVAQPIRVIAKPADSK
ncbi:hypothetical protein [Companilactobacillus baiquanensis]|uniref:Uncharacterized protein n=1 Tax=Companilactobacillus baiquanensis TaxID=2486005 RepID=A0ABW1UT32_9LACO|nr:hypothetical protein [Companilactobacillus baiquanensis]